MFRWIVYIGILFSYFAIPAMEKVCLLKKINKYGADKVFGYRIVDCLKLYLLSSIIAKNRIIENRKIATKKKYCI